ncbi:MAG: ABC-2 family transporter protein [Saccharofermentans sp.]|nr:ABC-2 family transporter protein [Mageeibacillus sp.]MCI1264652.1 ABC-2 family transporter protein [Saccharofermentans sp.]MCI1274636.1 ABC-2 family transporter protein [Saccharofermentans sp.]MCI1768663.1 ABC-2 family transporter protein [Mageeibacillus sp.]
MIKKYLSMIRVGFLDNMQFRLALAVQVIGNMIYLVLMYFLWKAIFDSSPVDTINGMTFEDTMIYLVLASAILEFIEMWIVWGVGRDVQSGQIVVDLLRPVNYRTNMFFTCFGGTIVNLIATFIPTMIVVYFVAGRAYALSWNLLWFFISLILSILINYYINFFTATITFYTESVWGINVAREVVVGVLSGATIPLAFFPDAFRKVAEILPFQGICNSPLTLLLGDGMAPSEVISILGVQLFWVVALSVVSGLFFKVSVRRITVNGG